MDVNDPQHDGKPAAARAETTKRQQAARLAAGRAVGQRKAAAVSRQRHAQPAVKPCNGTRVERRVTLRLDRQGVQRLPGHLQQQPADAHRPRSLHRGLIFQRGAPASEERRDVPAARAMRRQAVARSNATPAHRPKQTSVAMTSGVRHTSEQRPAVAKACRAIRSTRTSMPPTAERQPQHTTTSGRPPDQPAAAARQPGNRLSAQNSATDCSSGQPEHIDAEIQPAVHDARRGQPDRAHMTAATDEATIPALGIAAPAHPGLLAGQEAHRRLSR